MRFFDRRRSSPQQVPEWAAFFTPDEHARFTAALEQFLRSRRISFEYIDGGGVRIGGATDEQIIGLTNLGQKCKAAPAAEWPTIIHGHLTSLFAQHAAASAREPMRFLEAEPRLRVRLLPADYGEMSALSLIARPFAPGVIAAVALDFPDTVSMVPPKQADDWGVPGSELFDIGFRNVLEQERLEPQQVGTPAGPLTMLASDSFYTATQAAFLDKWVTPSPNGAILAIPNRHVILFEAIRDLSIVKSINLALVAAAAFFRDGPGSITPSLFWWRNGAIAVLPGGVGTDGASFSPPDAFVDVLNGLPQPGGGTS